MSTPELKAKKSTRAAAWAKASAEAAKKVESDKAANMKAFAARAKQYEAEYAKVCRNHSNEIISLNLRCMYDV